MTLPHGDSLAVEVAARTVVDLPAAAEQQHVVEDGEDGGARLVDDADDGLALVRQPPQHVNHHQRARRVQARLPGPETAV